MLAHLSIVQYLINEHSMKEQYLLHYACMRNSLDLVQYLINEQHYDPMSRDRWNNTPLHWACYRCHAHIVQYLLSTGQVDPLGTTNYHKTALQLARKQSNNNDNKREPFDADEEHEEHWRNRFCRCS